MVEEGHECCMRMLNLVWKLSETTDFKGNMSSCDGISRVWMKSMTTGWGYERRWIG